MLKVNIVLGVVLAVFVAESISYKIIQPTYRPPRYPKPKPIRIVREASEQTPLSSEDLVSSIDQLESLNRHARSLDSPSAKRGGGSHSTSSGSRDTGATHPGSNRRNARSVDSPSAKRVGGGPRTSSGSRNIGPTHPGYNRRNAREIRLPGHLNPLRPKPLFPRPTFPAPVPRIPIYARTARDIQFPGVRKPTHRDVIIPNWNPHIKKNPWDSLGSKRYARSVDFSEELNDVQFDELPGERVARDVHISGLPKKPTHRDVIIPNWNPHVKTNPWNSLGGKGRHGRSIDNTEEVNDAEFDEHLSERVARDIHVGGMPRKPTHRDVIIPNWNPHVKTNPWNSLGGKGRHGRSIDNTEEVNDAEFDEHLSERVARDIHVGGMPRKPTHRDVIIPNWNPHVKTNPWNSLGGKGRHGRSIDVTEEVNDAEFDEHLSERVTRDIHVGGMPRKPTHRDVIIPNWNPHVKTNPWNRLGGKGRHGRSIDNTEEVNDADFDEHLYERVARDIHVDGLPKKPTHRDVIIPNWNPHVKTNPWNSLGGRGRH